jgi:hypothetical protein
MGGFQTRVTVQPAIGVEGDFASANPRFSVIAGAGAFVCGDFGVRVARFAWAADQHEDDVGGPAVVNNFGSGPVTGFVHREQQGMLTQYLQESSMLVPAGQPITLMNGGDFVVKNAGSNQALIGMKAYANFQDGSVRFGPAGAPDSGGTSTSSTIAAETSSFTGSIEGNILTASAVTGTLYNGTVVAGSGVPTGAHIVNQVLPLQDGEALRGAGRYALNLSEQDIDTEAMTGSYGLMTIGGTVAGTFAVGQPANGSGISDGTVITDLGTGTGAAGTYIVNLTQSITPGQAINTALDVETKWSAMSPGLSTELVKISDHPLG